GAEQYRHGTPGGRFAPRARAVAAVVGTRANRWRAGTGAQAEEGRTPTAPENASERLRQRWIQDLRYFRPCRAAPARLPENRRRGRAPLRHGRELRLHLDRDGGLSRQHSGDIRYPRSTPSRRSLALVAARSAYRRRGNTHVARTQLWLASRAAARRPDVGRSVASRHARDRRVRYHPAAHDRRL